MEWLYHSKLRIPTTPGTNLDVSRSATGFASAIIETVITTSVACVTVGFITPAAVIVRIHIFLFLSIHGVDG